MLKRAGDFKWSRSKPEVRVRTLAKKFDAIRVDDDTAVCLKCGAYQKLRRDGGSLFLPSQCNSCKAVFSVKFDFCIPDLIMSNRFNGNGERKGAVLINEDWAHGKNRQVQRDAHQIQLLRQNGYGVFILNDSEVMQMTDSTLRAWLLGAFRSLESNTLPEYIYFGEKEYRCLQDD